MRFATILFTAAMLTAPGIAADNAMSNGSSMNNMSSGSMNHMSGGMMATSENCQTMIDQAKPGLDAMTGGAMKAKAMNEMHMAQTAMSHGHTQSCMSHMHKAMGMMH